MNSVSSIRSELEAIQTSAQVEAVQIIAAGRQVIKARIYVTPDLSIVRSFSLTKKCRTHNNMLPEFEPSPKLNRLLVSAYNPVPSKTCWVL